MLKRRMPSIQLLLVGIISVSLMISCASTGEHPGKAVGGGEHPGKAVGDAEHPGKAVGDAEHPGKKVEHPGKEVEHPGEKVEITADFIKNSIREHVAAESSGGAFSIDDAETGKTWRLKLDKIHDPVRQFEKGEQMIYFTCSDFQSMDSDDVLDIDFWMVPVGQGLKVIDTKIHKRNGKPRYMYEGVEIKEIESRPSG